MFLALGLTGEDAAHAGSNGRAQRVEVIPTLEGQGHAGKPEASPERAEQHSHRLSRAPFRRSA